MWGKPLALALCVGALLASSLAPGQSLLPVVKPVRIIVPGPPGGPAGPMAQLFALKVGKYLDQPVIVEYKPGAGGNIAIEYVARSPADGYTLFFAVPALVTNPYFQKISLDPDVLVPVVQLNAGPFLLLVNPASPYHSVADVIAAIRQRPGDITCAAGSVALSTVSCHLLQAYAGRMLLVAYPGNAQAAAALERGEISVLFDFMNSSGAAVKEGRLRALAVTSKLAPAGAFNGLPSISDTIPGFDLVGWQGIMVPRNTPADIVGRLNVAFNKVLVEDDVRQFYMANNIDFGGGSAESFAARIKRDYEFYGRVAKEAGIEPQ